MFVQILFWTLLFWLGAVAGVILVIQLFGEIKATLDRERTMTLKR